MAKIVDLIYTQERRGRGVEDDPVRLVDQWWTREGDLLFEHDSWDDKIKSLTTKAYQEVVDNLTDTIRWALGETGDFPLRGAKDGAYWWRKSLRNSLDEAKNKFHQRLTDIDHMKR